MTVYLKIENPGVAAPEAFTILGASTSRSSTNSNTIGKFGSGNKMGVATLLRHKLSPIVFAGNLKLEFGTRPQEMDSGISQHTFERVIVKFGGKDITGASRTNTEDLGFVLEYGATDWLDVDLALREFVSNAIDRAIEEGEHKVRCSYDDPEGNYRETQECLDAYRETARDFQNVVVEIVNENQVRAKAGHTRVFIPVNADVLEFTNNIGKWFLHFSEPELLNHTILPKSNRNIGDTHTAVIYRRGVRVRQFETENIPSLFDYNLEDLDLDESRKVDDWNILHKSACALSKGNEDQIAKLWQSFLDLDSNLYWEHTFSRYGLESALHNVENQETWTKAFAKIAGDNAVVSTTYGGELAHKKGFKVIVVPEAFTHVAGRTQIRTPDKVLSHDERNGQEIFDSNADAEAAVDFAWNLIEKYSLQKGQNRPAVKTFRKSFDSEKSPGFYREGVVYINQDISADGSLSLGWHGLTQKLLITALEMVAKHVTSTEVDLFDKDFQDLLLNLAVYAAKENAGI